MHRAAWASQNSKAFGQKREKPKQPRELPRVENRWWRVESRVVLQRGLEPNNPQIPLEKPGFQNEATRNPTRAATTSHALASHRLNNSPSSELLVLHRKVSRLAGIIARWSFLLENRSQRYRVLPNVGRENSMHKTIDTSTEADEVQLALMRAMSGRDRIR